MSDLFPYLLRSGACLALFYAFYRLVLVRDTNFGLNRAFLVGAAVLALVLPIVRVTSPFFKTVVPSSALAMNSGPDLGTAAGPAAGGLGPLVIAYAAGAALTLGLFLARLGRLALMAARCGCQRHRGLRVVLCGHSGESFSFFNFVFLDRDRVPGGDIDRILAHELAHVRQLHSFDIVLSEILTVVQWFNPFVWPYKRSLRETHEYLADRAVIAQGCSLARYQLLIVEQHVGGRLLELASSFRTSQIKRRIAMLSRQETKGLARWKPLLILPLAVVVVLAFAESRTVVRSEPSAGPVSIQAGQESAGKGGGKPVQLSDEEMAKALKEKSAKIEEMKKLNAETMSKLKVQLEAATSDEEKAKIRDEMQKQKLMSLELGSKERMLQMKKLEMAMVKETDEAKRAELEKKLQTLEAENADAQKKVEEVRKAEEKAKQASEKK
jgi:hypothetical protein